MRTKKSEKNCIVCKSGSLFDITNVCQCLRCGNIAEAGLTGSWGVSMKVTVYCAKLVGLRSKLINAKYDMSGKNT